MSLFQELKRRNVFRVSIAYAIVAWLILQILDVVVPILEIPDWVGKAVLLVVALGFPIVLVFAWAFELTPEGLKFERDVDRSQSITPTTGRKLDFMIIGVLVIGLVLFALDKFLWSADSESPVAEKRSIAVLPFINMSGDPEQLYFSDGISEEILNALVRVDGISVASRTSSFNFRDHQQSIPEIADALGVLFVLEGSVRKAGNQVRITAQLIDAKHDRHLWSDTYDRELVNIFAIQSEIANAITSEIHAELGIASDVEVQVKTLTEDMNAYDLYLKGSMAFLHRGVRQDVIDSMNWLEQAVALDPQFAAAWEALSATYTAIPWWKITDRTFEEYIQLSNNAADRALAIEPELVLARVVRANNLAIRPPYRVAEAILEFERALELEPTNTTANHWYGNTLLFLGYLEEGMAAQRRCLDIDLAYANCAFYLEQALHALGLHEEAVAVFEADQFEHIPWSDLVPTSVAHALLGGNRLAAQITADNLGGLIGAPGYLLVRALEHPEQDHSEGLRKFDAWAAENDVDLTDYPEILAAFGAYDRVDMAMIAEIWYWLPNYRHFRQSPEFGVLMRKGGYLEYWQERGFPPQCRAVGADDFECD